MINRRHIRVKVMQSVYALFKSNSDDLTKEEKFLNSSINKLYDLYGLILRLLVEVKNMEKKHIQISQKKLLATSEDLNPNTKYIENQLIKLIENSSSLNNYLSLKNLNYWILDDEYVSEIWKRVKKSDSYSRYMNSKSLSFQSDKEFVIAIIIHCLLSK